MNVLRGNRYGKVVIVIILLVLVYLLFCLYAMHSPVSWEKSWFVTEEHCIDDLQRLKRELEWEFLNGGKISSMKQLILETDLNVSTKEMYYLELGAYEVAEGVLARYTIYAWPINNLKYQGPNSLDLSAYAVTENGIFIRVPGKDGSMIWDRCEGCIVLPMEKKVPYLIKKKEGKK